MSETDANDNPVATDVHVAAPGRLRDVHRRGGGIMREVFRRFPVLGRMQGRFQRAKRDVARTVRTVRARIRHRVNQNGA